MHTPRHVAVALPTPGWEGAAVLRSSSAKGSGECLALREVQSSVDTCRGSEQFIENSILDELSNSAFFSHTIVENSPHFFSRHPCCRHRPPHRRSLLYVGLARRNTRLAWIREQERNDCNRWARQCGEVDAAASAGDGKLGRAAADDDGTLARVQRSERYVQSVGLGWA